MRKKISIAMIVISVIVASATWLLACRDRADKHMHSYVTSDVSPTCVDNGYTLYKCDCGESYKDNYAEATGIHSFGEYKYNNDATCVKDGTETRECKICKTKETRPVTDTATGIHSFVEYKYNDDATCVDDGTETAKCKHCDETKTRTKANTATGMHIFENYEYNDDATCVDDGTETAKCKHCDKQDTQAKKNSATGIHDYVDSVCRKCYLIDPCAQITDGLNYTEIEKNGLIVGYGVSKGEAKNKNYIKIPTIHQGKPVTRIDNNAFFDCGKLISIEIPNSITSIGNMAFSDCKSLTNVTIPSSVESIGVLVFWGCSELSRISVENGNTKYHSDGNCIIETASKTLIVGCRSSIISADGSVTGIGDRAFDSCRNLKSIVIPEPVTDIGNLAFNKCYSLKSVTLSATVVSIGDMAFSRCYKLSSITVESGNPKYQAHGNCLIETASKTLVFGCCSSEIPTDGSVTIIGDSAFLGCSDLRRIVIPDSIKIIGEDAFGSCSNLTSINIPSSVESIGKYAFANCNSLTKLEIPISVSRIGEYAFFATGSLILYCEAAQKPEGWSSQWNVSSVTVVWNYKNI